MLALEAGDEDEGNGGRRPQRGGSNGSGNGNGAGAGRMMSMRDLQLELGPPRRRPLPVGRRRRLWSARYWSGETDLS